MYSQRGNACGPTAGGAWDKLPGRYQEILAYAKEHDLRLFSFAYEKGINELVIDALDDYITQIEILVQAGQYGT